MKKESQQIKEGFEYTTCYMAEISKMMKACHESKPIKMANGGLYYVYGFYPVITNPPEPVTFSFRLKQQVIE